MTAPSASGHHQQDDHARTGGIINEPVLANIHFKRLGYGHSDSKEGWSELFLCFDTD